MTLDTSRREQRRLGDLAAHVRVLYPEGPPRVFVESEAICPLEPLTDATILTFESATWTCHSCRASWDVNGEDGAWLPLVPALDRQIRLEDLAEQEGLLRTFNRLTCGTCRAWATPDHIASAEHWDAIQTAVADRVALDELLQTLCQVKVPGGVLNGWCFLPLPCPDHPAVELADDTPADVDAEPAPLRRLDRQLAAGIGVGVGVGLSYAAGRALRPWSSAVPDGLVWTLTGALVLVAVAYTAVLLVARWLDGRRYAGHRILTADELAGCPAEGEVPDGR